jgi:hypothetical protein
VQFPRVSRVILVGLLALSAGPALIAFMPRLHPADQIAAWVMPTGVVESPAPASRPPALLVKGLHASESKVISRGGRDFLFTRFSHSVSAMDEDLVPWFAENWGSLIRQGSFTGGKDGRLQILSFERYSGTGGAVAARAFRVGDQIAAGFNEAKLLQIPVKLRGLGSMDMVLVTAECRRDCESVAEECAVLLDEILDANDVARDGA